MKTYFAVLSPSSRSAHSADLTSRFIPYSAFRENRDTVSEMIVMYWDTIVTQPRTNLIVGHTWHITTAETSWFLFVS